MQGTPGGLDTDGPAAAWFRCDCFEPAGAVRANGKGSHVVAHSNRALSVVITCQLPLAAYILLVTQVAQQNWSASPTSS